MTIRLAAKSLTQNASFAESLAVEGDVPKGISVTVTHGDVSIEGSLGGTVNCTDGCVKISKTIEVGATVSAPEGTVTCEIVTTDNSLSSIVTKALFTKIVEGHVVVSRMGPRKVFADRMDSLTI